METSSLKLLQISIEMLHNTGYTAYAKLRIFVFDTTIPVQVGYTQLNVLLN